MQQTVRSQSPFSKKREEENMKGVTVVAIVTVEAKAEVEATVAEEGLAEVHIIVEAQNTRRQKKDVSSVRNLATFKKIAPKQGKEIDHIPEIDKEEKLRKPDLRE
uniref:Uncharacterized protein n=1 Tax=Arcella intermedia TaxID=1963864 RepID=A0A6B2LSD7_9EUKA